MRWPELLAETKDALGANTDRPDIEARWIIESVSGASVHDLAEGPVPARAIARVDDMVDRRGRGEPLQYVLGAWAFRGLEVFVDRRVLIPRPETEVTAEHAIAAARACASTRVPVRVVDLGTGSGAIALAVAAEVPDAEIQATDVSEDALAVARANLAGAGTIATRVRLLPGSWFDALHSDLRRHVDVLVSNPPYVAETELGELAAEVREHEPRSALIAGPTGLEAIEHVISHAPEWLREDGTLVLELAPHQSDQAAGLARAAGFHRVRVEPDLSGRDRVLVGSRA
ncbi:MAG: peptide chain release factor N(5)-glutamine methyltransferase [Actinobacteria bacterium]|nr:peptide chain release factor N(5)-glutamine methyltransferase [Actinomycetota bacterium]